MRLMAVIPRVAPAVSPEARRVVAIVAGRRIGLNMRKSGVDTTNATAEPASVRHANANKTTEVTEATTTLITSNNVLRKENILYKILDLDDWWKEMDFMECVVYMYKT